MEISSSGSSTGSDGRQLDAVFPSVPFEHCLLGLDVNPDINVLVPAGVDVAVFLGSAQRSAQRLVILLVVMVPKCSLKGIGRLRPFAVRVLPSHKQEDSERITDVLLHPLAHLIRSPLAGC